MTKGIVVRPKIMNNLSKNKSNNDISKEKKDSYTVGCNEFVYQPIYFKNTFSIISIINIIIKFKGKLNE
jgi:hypothetical protein